MIDKNFIVGLLHNAGFNLIEYPIQIIPDLPAFYQHSVAIKYNFSYSLSGHIKRGLVFALIQRSNLESLKSSRTGELSILIKNLIHFFLQSVVEKLPPDYEVYLYSVETNRYAVILTWGTGEPSQHIRII